MQDLQFKNGLWSLFKQFSNLNFSIFILIIIVFWGILGSSIEQDQSLFYYQNAYPVSNSGIFTLDWRFIDYFGLNHVFQTWWFILTVVLFVLTLISCTFVTQLPSLKNARRWKFIHYNNGNNKNFSIDETYKLTDNSLNNMASSLLRLNFFVFCQNTSLYSYKGLYGRVAPIFVHFSIVFIFFGSMISLLFSFVAQEVVPNGELFHIKNVIHSGFISNLPVNILGRVNNFKIDYNLNNSIRQFYSYLSIISHNSADIISKIVFVNNPLYYHHIAIYQTDWQINALRISISSSKQMQKQLFKTSVNGKTCWICSFPTYFDKRVVFVIFNLNDPIQIYNSQGNFLGFVMLKQVFYLNGISFCIQNIIASTGLQVKVDPGIIFVYTGFFILMLSVVLSYLSYSQIWFYKQLSTFRFLASTNRAVLFFEDDVYYINCCYYSYYSTNSNIKCLSSRILL